MATIRDVARRAGVGVGTASRVISGRGSVAKETAARVKAAVAELGFRPSEIARALSTMSTGLVGVYVPDFHGDFFGPLLQTISCELRACHRRMVVANGFGDGDPRIQAINGLEFLIERECDGIIVLSNRLLDEDFLVLQKKQPRIAILNRVIPGLEEQCFSIDHYQGGILAARVLLSHGHQRFAVITGPHDALDNELRLEGFFAELSLHGISRESVPVQDGDFALAGGWDAAANFLNQGIRFTGLFCANDEMAMGAIAFLYSQGIRVPEDISVVGYDNTPMSAFTVPRLTTVSIPTSDIAANGCRWLLNVCFGTHLDYHRDFTLDIAWRDSVAALGS